MPLRPLLRLTVPLVGRLDRPKPGATVEERRAADAASPLGMRTLSRRSRKPVAERDHAVPVEGGSIRVRVYTPVAAVASADGPLGVHVYFHGGAFWLSTVDDYDPLCRWYAAEAGCVVVSAEYRLAPEYKYPTQPEDCYAALLWTVANAELLGVDTARVSVGGTSAGGSLAAAVTMMARDRGGPSLVLQVLEIPALDCTLSGASVQEFASGYVLTRAAMDEAVEFYLADPAQAYEPYASPLLAEDLSGLPPALVLTAEYDPLRDDGESYGTRLRAAGVPVEIRRYRGHIHGSFYITRFMPSARRASAAAVAALRRAHGRGRG